MAADIESTYLRLLLQGLRTGDTSLPFERIARSLWMLRNGLNGEATSRLSSWILPRRIRAVDLARFRLDFSSLRAAQRMMSLSDDYLIVTPAIPADCLRERLCEQTVESPEELSNLLGSFWLMGAITPEDEGDLAAAGCLERMPEGWTLSDGPFARFHMGRVPTQERTGTLRAIFAGGPERNLERDLAKLLDSGSP